MREREYYYDSNAESPIYHKAEDCTMLAFQGVEMADLKVREFTESEYENYEIRECPDCASGDILAELSKGR